MNIPRTSRKKRSYRYLLEDIYDAMLRIEKYIERSNAKTFMRDELVSDAAIRNFEVIGEAANNLPRRIKNKYPEIPWDRMYKLRNFLAHEYFGVDLHLVWRIAKDHIPGHIRDMERILEMEG
ncbi:MAG: DUF86 domain-containing protein [Balneolia bacterium]|nr:DUF86 domain-containing protein [Balneolia bacterium]